ncbi:MAG: hypothetical protein ACJ76J_30845 [Thermoanaerobaculia bacterium]
MSQVHLHLPDSLHRQLEERAQRAGVPLQSFIVDSLTRVVAVPGPAEQRAAFEELLSRYPQDQAEDALRDLLSSRD